MFLHFQTGIKPKVGKDMGDGWETKRSREKGHKDWAIIKLYSDDLRWIRLISDLSSEAMAAT